MPTSLATSLAENRSRGSDWPSPGRSQQARPSWVDHDLDGPLVSRCLENDRPKCTSGFRPEPGSIQHESSLSVSRVKHSTATELRRQGVPLDVIQKLCGHRDPRSTEVYAKLADQALVEAIRRPRLARPGRSPSPR